MTQGSGHSEHPEKVSILKTAGTAETLLSRQTSHFTIKHTHLFAHLSMEGQGLFFAHKSTSSFLVINPAYTTLMKHSLFPDSPKTEGHLLSNLSTQFF